MSESPTTVGNNRDALIGRFAPGLRQLQDYRREWLRIDLVAGVSVAAVAVPTAIAYAQLIGFEPIVGLYAAILPLVAYALFGTSRQLDRESRRGHLRHICRHGAAARRRRLRYPPVTVHGAGGIDRAGVHRCGDLPTRLPCRLSRKADPGRLSQWRGDQHLSRPDRQSVRLPHAITRHPPDGSSSLPGSCLKPISRRWPWD